MANVVVNDASLQDVANAIREKNGLETKYKPAEMGQAIRDIPSGGKEPVIEELSITGNGVYNAPEGIDGYNPISVNVPSAGGDLPPEALVITGDCRYRFANNGWNWFLRDYGNQITTEDIEDASYMFSATFDTNANANFVINMKENTAKFSNMFHQGNLRTLPRIKCNITKPNPSFVNFSEMLASASLLRNFDDLFYVNDLAELNNMKISSPYSGLNYGRMFNRCYSLRNIPSWFYNLRFSEESTSYMSAGSCIYSSQFEYNYVLDEIVDLPVIRANSNQTIDMFLSSFYECNRIKNMTFETNNGVPYAVNWKSQVINLSVFAGYVNSTFNITGYNSGITTDKMVTDAESYEALKNDPDWFTTKIEYSRYNHDSAVETINSLPDTSAYLASAGGTNTIKFKGQSGELTDGGAINTLTEEEIAVAAAKGWTVSLV